MGAEMSFTCGASRTCTGIWRAGRLIACPYATPIDGDARSAICASCATLDRSNSIAADTRLDDLRIFAVYLAHHGSAIKVGITAAERGASRLLEQGALASAIISTGRLISGRRAEHLLTHGLGLTDRVTTLAKRSARVRPGTASRRAADLVEVARKAEELPWPDGQARCEPEVTDHAISYGLPEDGLHPVAEVLPLTPLRTVTGTVRCRIGSDIYMDAADELVLLDMRLLAGWALTRANRGAAFTAPLRPFDRGETEHDVLF